jgi:hypothetical protein
VILAHRPHPRPYIGQRLCPPPRHARRVDTANRNPRPLWAVSLAIALYDRDSRRAAPSRALARLSVPGPRWGLPGAEAIHLLRAVIANGDFDQYWQFHIQQDYQRTHAQRNQEQFALAA